MRFEILVEGQTELTALSIIMSKIVGEYGNPHIWKIHKHQGIGKIPENPALKPNIKDKSLLHNLAAKLRAYGNENDPDLVIIVLVDLDDRKDCKEFKSNLLNLLNFCEKKPRVLFRIAIEELEAWYFGDFKALKKVYPDLNQDIFKQYIQDSQIGTWEMFAKMIDSNILNLIETKGKRSPLILEEKLKWTKMIAPNLNIEENQSPSFCCFRDGLRKMCS